MIAREVKLAVILWLLAGSSYLDLGLFYGLRYGNLYEIFHNVLRDWITNNDVINIDFYANVT